MPMTIRNARTKVAIIKIDDEGNMFILDEMGLEKPYPDPVELVKQENKDATN